jgi:Homeodomain-like domain-containing protein
MAHTVCILLEAEERTRLAAIVGDRNRPYKHIQRVRIVLLSADRLPVVAVARQAGVSRPAVWRWQQRFAEQGVEGLVRDKTRKARQETAARGDGGQNPGTPLRRAARTSHSLDGPHGRPGGRRQPARGAAHLARQPSLQPHRIRTLKKSNDRRSSKRSKTSSGST